MGKHRPEPYHPPPSKLHQELLDAERQWIDTGDTCGLDAGREYLAVRVSRENKPPVWVICPDPLDAGLLDGTVLFVARVTLGSAIYMVKHGAEVLKD